MDSWNIIIHKVLNVNVYIFTKYVASHPAENRARATLNLLKWQNMTSVNWCYLPASVPKVFAGGRNKYNYLLSAP